ncbi:hypothetical protein Bbelb_015480 [Branchiostoma belcheri]|nr:hypothetical protein Bbelb_015480 [Branchiostoma belcheri]
MAQHTRHDWSPQRHSQRLNAQLGRATSDCRQIAPNDRLLSESRCFQRVFLTSQVSGSCRSSPEGGPRAIEGHGPTLGLRVIEGHGPLHTYEFIYAVSLEHTVDGSDMCRHRHWRFAPKCPEHCVQKQCHYEYGCFQCMQGYLAHFVDGNCARSKYGTCVITCPDGYQPDPTNEFCQVYETEED